MTQVTRIAGVGLLVAALLFAAAGVAAAHAVLVSTDPAKDTALAAGPTQVSAVFNERLQTEFAAMTVVGPDRNLWSTGDAQVQGAVVSVAVRPLGPAGTYTVNYRVTSADGHVVSGSWPFRLTVPGTGEPGPPVVAPADDSRHAAGAPAGGAGLPIWPFVAGAVVIVGAGLWVARPNS